MGSGGRELENWRGRGRAGLENLFARVVFLPPEQVQQPVRSRNECVS